MKHYLVTLDVNIGNHESESVSLIRAASLSAAVKTAFELEANGKLSPLDDGMFDEGNKGIYYVNKIQEVEPFEVATLSKYFPVFVSTEASYQYFSLSISDISVPNKNIESLPYLIVAALELTFPNGKINEQVINKAIGELLVNYGENYFSKENGDITLAVTGLDPLTVRVDTQVIGVFREFKITPKPITSDIYTALALNGVECI